MFTSHTSMRHRVNSSAPGFRLLVAVALLTEAACITWGAMPSENAQRTPGRFTVRTSMATGTKTTRSGLMWLDSLYPGDSLLAKMALYVPKRCVGSKRCPLLLNLHGGSGDAAGVVDGYDHLYLKFADSTGIIVLAPTSFSSDQGWGDPHDTANVDVPRVDHALKTILRDFAIDPTRITLMGGSAGSSPALGWGTTNGDFFSHIVLLSGFAPFAGLQELNAYTLHGTPPIYYGLNIHEAEALDLDTFADWMRKKGYSFTVVKDSTDHGAGDRIGPSLTWLLKETR